MGPCLPTGEPAHVCAPALGRACRTCCLFGELGQGGTGHLGPRSGLRSAPAHRLCCGMEALGSSIPGRSLHPLLLSCCQECTLKVQDGKFKLQDLLVVPMQRVLKYHLLLKVRPCACSGAACRGGDGPPWAGVREEPAHPYSWPAWRLSGRGFTGNGQREIGMELCERAENSRQNASPDQE